MKWCFLFFILSWSPGWYVYKKSRPRTRCALIGWRLHTHRSKAVDQKHPEHSKCIKYMPRSECHLPVQQTVNHTACWPPQRSCASTHPKIPLTFTVKIVESQQRSFCHVEVKNSFLSTAGEPTKHSEGGRHVTEGGLTWESFPVNVLIRFTIHLFTFHSKTLLKFSHSLFCCVVTSCWYDEWRAAAMILINFRSFLWTGSLKL